jgi:hypothetical protein
VGHTVGSVLRGGPWPPPAERKASSYPRDSLRPVVSRVNVANSVANSEVANSEEDVPPMKLPAASYEESQVDIQVHMAHGPRRLQAQQILIECGVLHGRPLLGRPYYSFTLSTENSKGRGQHSSRRQ